ncbi:MAG: DNA repair protein RadA, partial [Malacoplasma sp.]|nr:DNA repair protein RadA [Malacoplasma sp.]
SCGHESPKWMGRCPACGEWNTFVEEKVSTRQPSKQKGLLTTSGARPIKLSEIEPLDEPRIHMPSEELNRVLGGGLVAGSLTLLGGEPGIGKSTLLLQNILSIRNKKIIIEDNNYHSLIKLVNLCANKIHVFPINKIIFCNGFNNFYSEINLGIYKYSQNLELIKKWKVFEYLYDKYNTKS